MTDTTAQASTEQLVPCNSPWWVPDGFSTYELNQIVDGPIQSAAGVIDYGPRVYHWGIQHVYDDGDLRIVVRPGNRDSYVSGGYHMMIESMAGQPGQHFPNVESALAAARAEVRRLSAGRSQR